MTLKTMTTGRLIGLLVDMLLGLACMGAALLLLIGAIDPSRGLLVLALMGAGSGFSAYALQRSADV